MGEKNSTELTRRSIFYWVLHGNIKLQLVLLFIILLVVITRVLPLEMQKRIINDSIALRKFDNLILYSCIYIASVVASNGLKLAINYVQTIIGEKAMVEMRKELYRHIITLPLSFFRKTQPGMVVSSLVTELSTAGSFAGMAISVPVTNILTLLALGGYLIWLNPKLALATLGIYPFIVFVLPRLQKKANVANAERVDLSRKFSSQIAESITGIHEVQVHGAYTRESVKFDLLAETLRKIRIRWTLLRQGIKTTNNFFVSLGPFIVFIFGGMLILRGELELGAMVAFLSAQEKLYDPWKELVDYYQVFQDAQVRYSRTMNQYSALADFDPAFTRDEERILEGAIEVTDLVFDTPEGVRLLDGVSMKLEPGEHLAVVGFSGSGKSTLVQCIARMHKYSAGKITLDGHDLLDFTKKDIITNIGYISQSPFIFTGTIRENLLYAEQAVEEIGVPPEALPKFEPPPLDRLILCLQQAGLFVDVLRFGLKSALAGSSQDMMEKIVRMRSSFRKNFGEQLADYVEFYEAGKFLYQATLAENILFGMYQDRNWNMERLIGHKDFGAFIKFAGLEDLLVDLGIEIAHQTEDILSGYGSVKSFFRYSPVEPSRMNEYRKLLDRIRPAKNYRMAEDDKATLMRLALNYSPGQHKVATFTQEMEEGILRARTAWVNWSTEKYPGQFSHYNEQDYIIDESILNNIFFGRVVTDLPHVQEKISVAMIQLLIEEDLLEEIAGIGMDFEVGSMGDRLSGGQRQKLAIARVLLKEPRVIIMDEATSALDNKSQARIQQLMDSRWKGKWTVISVVHRLDSIANFDFVAVMKGGKIVEFGNYQELMKKKGVLYELVSGRR